MTTKTYILQENEVEALKSLMVEIETLKHQIEEYKVPTGYELVAYGKSNMDSFIEHQEKKKELKTVMIEDFDDEVEHEERVNMLIQEIADYVQPSEIDFHEYGKQDMPQQVKYNNLVGSLKYKREELEQIILSLMQ